MASRKACKSTVPYSPLAVGSLDARTPLGIGYHNLFRYLLNCDSVEQGKLSRMPGWTGWMACESNAVGFNRGNLDLHDQLAGVFYKTQSTTTTHAGDYIGNVETGLLGVTVVTVVSTAGFAVDDQITFVGFETIIARVEEIIDTTHFSIRGDAYALIPVGTVVNGQPTSEINFEYEPINHITQITSACNTREFLAFTTSRVYLSTGTSANWRVLAFDLSGNKGDLPSYGQVRWMSAQLGNYILFTNNYDFVMSWRVNDPPDPVGGWSAKYVQSLVELDIRRAGCIASWSGFIFIGDVETSHGSECSRIYWSDFNNPMEWAPGGESLAGFVDLGKTEKVLRLETIGGQLKVYTTNAIYNVTAVGGEEVFRFQEVYRGPDALAFRFALANLGDSHVYLSNRTMVETQLYNNTPVQVDWVHRAAGAIYRGIPNSVVHGLPGQSESFGPLDFYRCNEIVMGYDRYRRQVWVSWPTTTTSSTGYGGIKRMSMVLSRLYSQATLVDHAFSAFTSFIPTLNDSVRNWMVEIGACTQEQIAEMVLAYEGTPLNPITSVSPMPTWLVNEDERSLVIPFDGDNVNPNSVCFIYGNENILAGNWCNPCFSPTAFAMASLEDLTIKQLEPRVRLRERWDPATASYKSDGYGCIAVSEMSIVGTDKEKTVTEITCDLLHSALAVPLNLHAQCVVSATPDCTDVWDAEPRKIMCDSEDPAINPLTTRMPGNFDFPFYATGRYCGWRWFLSSGEATAYNFKPVGGEVDFNSVDLRIKVKQNCR